MKAAAVKSKKPDESRAAANSVFQKKSDPIETFGFSENQPGPAADRRISVPNGPAGSKEFIRLYAPSPVSGFPGFLKKNGKKMKGFEI